MKIKYFCACGVFFFVFLSECVTAQEIEYSKPFRLGSSNAEPGGRKDVVTLPNDEFVALFRVSGSAKKTIFALEKYTAQADVQWSTEIGAEGSEDFKDLYYNGKELVLLTVVHLEAQHKTILNAYGYDLSSGNQTWSKELESYQVGDWEENPHKGKVKESFTDVIFEHTNANFVTPFEYKHHLQFSPDGTKFVSYVFNYGERALSAQACIYDNAANLIKKSKISIDNDYVNYGIFVNNDADLFILNANNSGKVNFIRFDPDTKDFSVLELPSTNYQKDDFHVQFLSNHKILVGNTELNFKGAFAGVMYSVFDFDQQKVEKSIFQEYNVEMKSKVSEIRKNNKSLKGDENWLDYDLAYFNQDAEGQVFFILEKRALYADGYPHIARGTFDKSHNVTIDGHVQTEGIIIMSFNGKNELQWHTYVPKNQVYPAVDGLNTLSFICDNSQANQLRVLYAYSEGMDASLHNLRYLLYNKKTGALSSDVLLPNPDKLTLVRDYTMWPTNNRLVLVGRKGLLGKTSIIVSYKL